LAHFWQTALRSLNERSNQGVTKEILGRAEVAIGRGEAKGPKVDLSWKRLEKLNGGIVGPKSWEQIRRIAASALNGKGTEVSDAPGD
jgi:hypothetical protein